MFFRDCLLTIIGAPTCIDSPGITTMRRRIVCGIAVILSAAGCANPKVQADLMAEINAAADEINAQRQEMAMLQEQVDSLKFAVAKQDTVLRKLMNLAGLPGVQ